MLELLEAFGFEYSEAMLIFQAYNGSKLEKVDRLASARDDTAPWGGFLVLPSVMLKVVYWRIRSC